MMKRSLGAAWVVALVFLAFGCGDDDGVKPKADFWQETNGPGSGVTRSLTISPSTPAFPSGLVFCGTMSERVFRSENNGDSWVQANSGLNYNPVMALAINSSGHVFAGTDGEGVFRSENIGDSWVQVNNGIINLGVNALAISSSGHIFAGTYGGVYRSEINGDSWVQLNSGLTNTDVRALAINSAGYVFAGTFGGGVFRSAKSTD